MPELRLIVVGVDPEGTEVAREVLGHGDDPTTLLAAGGWKVLRVREVISDQVEKRVLTMSFVVERRLSSQGQPSVDAERSVAPSAAAPVRRVQRVAAYAVVTSPRGVLMTQFSDRTGAPGQWGLPGGGLETDETPDRAVVREVWEESGQVVEVAELALVRTSRWVGQAPGGQVEDFHAVRVVYRAFCPEPTEPVVHDVGGTTAAAAWLLPADLGLLALTPGWRSILSEVVTAPDEPDRPDHHHHDTDADDPGRPQP